MLPMVPMFPVRSGYATIQAMRVSELKLAGLDFETSEYGPDSGSGGEPVQIGIAVMDAGTLMPHLSFCHDLESGNPSAYTALWPDIHARLAGRWIVAHGMGTEKKMLRAFPTHGFDPWIDTLKLTRRLYPKQSSHRLGDLVRLFRLEEELARLHPGRAWHDALYDATATLLLLRHCIHSAGLDNASADMLLDPP